MHTPELLAPAGNMNKLRFALAYGADAVYLAGDRFGLRAYADNFDADGLARAAAYVHERGKKLYVTVNIYADEDDIAALPEYARLIADVGADGAIVSDLGVFSVFRKHAPEVDLHVSTQANVTNGAAARGERRGVCESCGKYGFCIENENGRYVCADCLAKRLPPADRRRYVLPAAILTDEFASNLLTEEEKGKTVARLLDSLRRTGKIPSAGKNDTTVGYEFGYFLLAAAREGDSSAEELYRRTMRLWENSGTGSWAEMYEGERPLLQHTLFRPWESCINLYASIKYANREGKE